MWAGPRVINHLGALPPCSLSLDSFFLHPTWAMAESSYARVSVAVKARTHNRPSNEDGMGEQIF